MCYLHGRALFLCLQLPYPLKPRKRSVLQKLTAGLHCQWQCSHNSLNVERPSMGTHGAIEVPASCALVSLVEEGTQKATKRETWATIQKSSHKTFDLEASRPIICAAKTREPSINAFLLLSAHSLVHPYFGWAFLPQWSPLRDPSTSCCLDFSITTDCNLELSAKETLSSLNCCCWILDHSNREQN